MGVMHTTAKLLILSAALLVVFLLSTDPAKLPSAMLIVPFLLAFFIIFLSAKLLLGANKQRTGLIMLVAVIGVISLALQSLGQLTIRDGVMLLILFVVGYFYVNRRAATTK